ncbi:MAG TPA: imelysin family protein [Polyangiales bacterium]|nr:imelysin family protein [Polyangiales bacterium]
MKLGVVSRLASVLLWGGMLACARSELSPELAKQGVTTYANLAQAGYEDALAAAVQLRDAVDALVAAPSAETLQAARAAWRAARVPYLQTETYRFYEGPIDRVELLVNTWPIDESYVEALLVGQQPLDAALLVSLNAKAGETSISTGYHVIEFLLWGRDTSADGPGARAADFTERERTYLQLATQLLIDHLTQVVHAWRGSYRAELLALPPKQALTLALRGMGTFSGPELSGERLTVPYETRDQENEQSCFSDTTDQDVKLDARGVQNVCLGRYNDRQGVGICALVSALDAKLGKQLESEIAASVHAAEGIPAPFDQALIGADDAPGRAAIKRTITALQAQTESITRAVALASGP